MSRPDEAAPALIYKEGDEIILDGAEFTSQLPGSPVTKVLTNAEFKALPSAPYYVILPATSGSLGYAGEPNEIFIPTFAYGVLDTRAGAYGNVDSAAYLKLLLSSDASMDMSIQTRLAPGSHVTATRVSLIPFKFPAPFVVATDGEAGNASPYVHPSPLTANLEDNALVIYADNNSAGDFTGGHADNTLTLVIHYETVAIPS